MTLSTFTHLLQAAADFWLLEHTHSLPHTLHTNNAHSQCGHTTRPTGAGRSNRPRQLGATFSCWGDVLRAPFFLFFWMFLHFTSSWLFQLLVVTLFVIFSSFLDDYFFDSPHSEGETSNKQDSTLFTCFAIHDGEVDSLFCRKVPFPNSRLSPKPHTKN